jgi:molybdate/tungstate transport system substrate-binding protein
VKILTILGALLTLGGAPDSAVDVAYAGSLVRVMQGPFAASLQKHTGLHFAGEAKGSKALAHLIMAGLRTPDVFVSADAALMDALMKADRPFISGYTIFGSARMVLAYSTRSAHRQLFEQAQHGRRSLLDVLADRRVSVGRTDPALDPKGERTVRVLNLLGKYFHRPRQVSAILMKSATYPEEDLAVRVESGELDAGFFYSTEVSGRNLSVVELPLSANLSNDITYALAVLRHAQHAAAAKTCVDFLLKGAGKTIVEQAGVKYFSHPRIIGRP